jgi:hypothetical protein
LESSPLAVCIDKPYSRKKGAMDVVPPCDTNLSQKAHIIFPFPAFFEIDSKVRN